MPELDAEVARFSKTTVTSGSLMVSMTPAGTKLRSSFRLCSPYGHLSIAKPVARNPGWIQAPGNFAADRIGFG